MPCVLWISGDFTTEELTGKLLITPYKTIEKGATVQTKDGPKKYEQALCGFDVSSKDFTDFQSLVGDAIAYLEEHFNDLQVLAEMPAVHAKLDFGYFTSFMDNHIVAQYDTLPYQLLRLAGNLKIDIELSQYWHGDVNKN
ncbi:DUF4279 domain-containing protein [Chitinophagaceae bacterium MMS25-I14]